MWSYYRSLFPYIGIAIAFTEAAPFKRWYSGVCDCNTRDHNTRVCGDWWLHDHETTTGYQGA